MTAHWITTLSNDLFAWIDGWAPQLAVLLSTTADLAGKLLVFALESLAPQGLV